MAFEVDFKEYHKVEKINKITNVFKIWTGYRETFTR